MLASISRRTARIWLSAMLAAAAFGVVAAAPAVAALPGSVYTQTNSQAGNEVVVFTRAPDGTLTETSRTATGGLGDNSTPPFGFEILDSSGGVELSDSEHLVFAVNAGSDTVSSFRVLPGGGLLLVDTAATGDLPVSVDSDGDLVYVLNEGDLGPGGPFDVDDPNPAAGTIQGYRVSADGQLTPIAGSLEPLSVTGSALAVAAQIGFDPTGRTLTVTHRLTGPPPMPGQRIDTFVLNADDTPGPAIPNAGTGVAPFGFAYDANGHAIVANALDNSISSYQLDTTTGTLTLIDNEPTTEGAPCWVAITPDNQFAFVTNTSSGTVTRLRIEANGALTELGQTPVPGGSAPADVALSHDGRFLTVLAVGLTSPTPSYTVTYAVGPDGSLALLPGGMTPANLPAGASGLAASAPSTAAGHWRFGERPGSTELLDSSANGNHGTYLGGVTLGIPGALANDTDTAARFDGNNDLGRVPDSASLDVGSSFTVEGWIKRSSTTRSHQLFLKGSGGLQLVVMAATSGNQVWLRKANVTTLARSATGVPAGGYHHVAATMDGPGTAKIYIDGVESTVPVSTVQAIQDTTLPLFFGTTGTTPADFDEFALYDEALSATEIAAHAAAGI